MSPLAWKLMGGLIAALWIASLFFAVATSDPTGNEWWDGPQILLLGWGGIAMFQFAWFANPIMILFAVPFGFFGNPRPTSSIAMAVILWVLGANALFWSVVPASAGWTREILKYGPGYYLWLGAVFLAASGLTVRWMQTR